jgi:hypothetical protein
MTEAKTDEARIKIVENCLAELEASLATVRGMGPNGPEIVGLTGKWSVALLVLTKTQDADVIGVFVNTESNHEIDFHWGWTTDDPKVKGQGLAKLVRWHPTVVADLSQIVANAVAVTSPTPDRLVLSDGKHLVVISERHFDTQKRWLVTAFHAGSKPSKKDRALLNQAKRIISQATSRTVDGASVAGQTDASISGTSSTDRLVRISIPASASKIKNE